MTRRYRMVEEIASSYRAEPQSDGSLSIRITVPERFADLFLAKMTDLYTDDVEIAYWESDEDDPSGEEAESP